MAYRLDIPGQVSIHQLKAIELVASLVPVGGIVVEVGSLFGRSSWAWGASVDPSVEVFCIDPWERNEGVRSMEIQHGIKYGIEQFKEFTKDVGNIRPLQGYSPADFQDWERPIDLYYEDAVHTNPILARNLEFWSSKLKPRGILCGDDYRPRFPDVRSGVQRLAQQFNRELIQVDFFWCLLPPDHVLPGSTLVQQELKAIAAEASAEKRARGRLILVAPRHKFAHVKAGGSPIVEMRASNEGLDPWPSPDDKVPVAAVQILTATQPRRQVAETRISLGIGSLGPDLPVDFNLVLPTGTLPPGDYLADFDIVDGFACALSHKHLDMIKGVPFSIIDEASDIDTTDSASLPEKSQQGSEVGLQGAPYTLGTPIDFTAGGNAGPYKHQGWVGEEKQHTWSQGTESRLILAPDAEASVLAKASGYHLLIELKPFVVSGKINAQALSISINDQTVFSGDLTQTKVLSIDIPTAVITSSYPICIRFTHPNCTRPIDVLAGSQDKKLLAFAFRRLVLSAVQ
jgi:hypothetical protein